MITKRQGLIVWFQHMKNLKQIKRYGHLLFSSKKFKYAVLYVDQDELENAEKRLESFPFISKLERSYKPFVRTDFENSKPDKAKQYDYEHTLGI